MVGCAVLPIIGGFGLLIGIFFLKKKFGDDFPMWPAYLSQAISFGGGLLGELLHVELCFHCGYPTCELFWGAPPAGALSKSSHQRARVTSALTQACGSALALLLSLTQHPLCACTGISYGALSASWDPNRAGTLSGWTEFRANLPLLLELTKKDRR